MNRRKLLKRSAALGFTAAGSLTLPCAAAATFDAAEESAGLNPLTPPANASIPVAFLISEGAVVIDFAAHGKFSKESTFPAGSMMRSVSILSRSLRVPLLRAAD